jgi:hypothetical protein
MYLRFLNGKDGALFIFEFYAVLSTALNTAETLKTIYATGCTMLNVQARGMAQLVEHLPSKRHAETNPNTTK